MIRMCYSLIRRLKNAVFRKQTVPTFISNRFQATKITSKAVGIKSTLFYTCVYLWFCEHSSLLLTYNKVDDDDNHAEVLMFLFSMFSIFETADIRVIVRMDFIILFCVVAVDFWSCSK